MDDLSSQSAPQDPVPDHVPGIHELLSSFGAIFLEMAEGIREAQPGAVDPEDWKDVFQATSLDAWKIHLTDASYFESRAVRRWASQTAHNKRIDNERRESRRTLREETFIREFLACRCNGDVLQEMIEEERERERDRALVRALKLLRPVDFDVLIKRCLYGLSGRETAADLGLSERAVRRSYDETRRHLSLALAEWDPRGSGAARAPGADTDAPQGEGGDHD